jgi:sarcosine oxidase subunit alpha
MNQPYRIAGGGRVDRSRPLNFTFNGKAFQGYSGDTLASALLANGVRTISRSFKFHRPRGVLSAGVEESNALVGVDYGCGVVPIIRATRMPLIDGLRAESQNCFPSVNFDLLRVLDYTRPLWPAGFYNKVFKWPNWHAFEWAVRQTAGLGRLPDGLDPARYCHMNTHCDVLVVGTGPAGLAAALEAARRGDDVLVVEQDAEPGGSLLHDSMVIDRRSSDSWLVETITELNACENVRAMVSATVVGYYDHNVLTIHDYSSAYRRENPVETFWKVRAGRVVLANGAIEQPLVFGNNDLPGIMLAGAMHQYASRYGVRCGGRVVGVVNNDLAWHSIVALRDAGIEVPAIIDTRDTVNDALSDRAEELGIAVHVGATPLYARGSGVVKRLRFSDGKGRSKIVSCDAIAMSGGLSPIVHLYSQAGGRLRYDDDLACFVPQECRQQVEVVGAANGEFATADTYKIGSRKRSPAKTNSQWIDFLHDITASDIELAVRENYRSVEHLKRYTTVGMAVDQGKTSNLNALTLLGELTGKTPGETGSTTFRPMFTPVTMGAIAGNRQGDFYQPAKRLPAHDWHADKGAVFEDYGGWDRPAYYGKDREECIARESLIVRESVGLFDGSPLGKIEVKGPDAAEFLNRIYVNTVPSLKPGRIRYGLMLNETGVVMDDGVFIRLADEHFLVNTTSGHADSIAAWLEEWHQCEWPDLDLVLLPVTSQWAVATVAGPKSREVLQSLPGMVDLSTENLPHMSIADGEFADGTQYRIQRVSFTGEQSYELSVPANHATEIFERIWQAGKPHDIGLFGAESLMVLRLEKGFLHVGVDTDGTSNPLDIGFGKIVANKKADFIGARSLERAEDRRADRRQLVGFEVDDNATALAGAHIVTERGNERRTEGFVTSACISPTLGKTIGLGLLERGFERKGEKIELYDDGQVVSAKVVDACFYDPAGERMRG